jgi:DNA-binding SARP family transcriptional activator
MLLLRTLGTVEVARPGLRLVPQTKCLALLAYICVAGRGHAIQRDRLLALLWPELDDVHARHALRQALNRLRAEVGLDTVLSVGHDAVAANRERITCDVSRFERCVGENLLESALEYYRGPFLEGFHVPGARDYENWILSERSRLAEIAARSAWTLAERAAASRDHGSLRRWAGRGLECQPYNEERWREWVRCLQEIGDVSGALLAYRELERRMRNDLDLAPSHETRNVLGDLLGIT